MNATVLEYEKKKFFRVTHQIKASQRLTTRSQNQFCTQIREGNPTSTLNSITSEELKN